MSKQTKHQARFSQLPRRAVMDTDLSSTDFKVLAIIGLYLNHDHEAWPMQETIGDVGGMSKSTVSRSIKRLEDAGYIISRKKYPNKPGTHKCYAVVLDESGQDDTPGTVKNDTSGNVTDATQELHPGCNSGISSKDATPIRTNPIELSHMNKSASRAGDVHRVFEHYNRTAEASGWVVCKRLTDAHKRNISGRISDYCADDVCAFIDYLARLRWTSKGFENNRSFRASLGYVMRPRTFTEHFDKMPSRGLNLFEQPKSQADPLAQCFETYAKTGEWYGDRHGWVLKPEHPSAEYPRELYARFGLTKEIAA